MGTYRRVLNSQFVAFRFGISGRQSPKVFVAILMLRPSFLKSLTPNPVHATLYQLNANCG